LSGGGGPCSGGSCGAPSGHYGVELPAIESPAQAFAEMNQGNDENVKPVVDYANY